MDIPLQQFANMEDPGEAAAWAFVALPNSEGSGPLLTPPSTYTKWSQRFWDAGFRHHPELQTVQYYPPAANHNWIMGSAGHWGPVGEPMSAEVTAPDISHLTQQEKIVLLQRLNDEISGTLDQSNYGGVVE